MVLIGFVEFLLTQFHDFVEHLWILIYFIFWKEKCNLLCVVKWIDQNPRKKEKIRRERRE